MFRKKDPAEPTPPPEAGWGAAAPPAAAQQPELPRRGLDLPVAPPQAAPPPRINVAAALPPGTAAPTPAVRGQPATAPAEGAGAAAAEEGGAAGKRLIVGRGIRLSGEITACDRLLVEGEVEAILNETGRLEIAPGGRFIGGCVVEEAEIAGALEGELTVRGRLLVRAGGRITGRIRYGELEVERGGRIAGGIGVTGEEAADEGLAAPPASAAAGTVAEDHVPAGPRPVPSEGEREAPEPEPDPAADEADGGEDRAVGRMAAG